MDAAIVTSPPPTVDDRARFVAGRLSNGHFGVFDALLESYVLRDVASAFAESVAFRLNRPDTWQPTAPQFVADAVRHVLKTSSATARRPPTD